MHVTLLSRAHPHPAAEQGRLIYEKGQLPPGFRVDTRKELDQYKYSPGDIGRRGTRGGGSPVQEFTASPNVPHRMSGTRYIPARVASESPIPPVQKNEGLHLPSAIRVILTLKRARQAENWLANDSWAFKELYDMMPRIEIVNSKYTMSLDILNPFLLPRFAMRFFNSLATNIAPLFRFLYLLYLPSQKIGTRFSKQYETFNSLLFETQTEWLNEHVPLNISVPYNFVSADSLLITKLIV